MSCRALQPNSIGQNVGFIWVNKKGMIAMDFVTVDDFCNVRTQAKKYGAKVGSGLILLPDNLQTANNPSELRSSGEASTAFKLLKQSGIDINHLNPEHDTLSVIRNNSFEWYGPILFLSAAVLTEQPLILGSVLEILQNYLVSLFRGVAGSGKVSLKIIAETNSEGSCKQFEYNGPPESLGLLKESIEKFIDGEN